jgi:hypothetical protein
MARNTYFLSIFEFVISSWQVSYIYLHLHMYMHINVHIYTVFLIQVLAVDQDDSELIGSSDPPTPALSSWDNRHVLLYPALNIFFS